MILNRGVYRETVLGKHSEVNFSPKLELEESEPAERHKLPPPTKSEDPITGIDAKHSPFFVAEGDNFHCLKTDLSFGNASFILCVLLK